jgi:hypothetical protein
MKEIRRKFVPATVPSVPNVKKHSADTGTPALPAMTEASGAPAATTPAEKRLSVNRGISARQHTDKKQSK